jgi:hypothetical protein
MLSPRPPWWDRARLTFKMNGHTGARTLFVDSTSVECLLNPLPESRTTLLRRNTSGGDPPPRGFYSSTFQLNLSRSCHCHHDRLTPLSVTLDPTKSACIQLKKWTSVSPCLGRLLLRQPQESNMIYPDPCGNGPHRCVVPAT